MKKIIFLEGLPNVGKTTIIQNIKKLGLKNIYTVDEVINNDTKQERTEYYLKNDELKLDCYDDGIIVIDRGMISTISYEQAKHIINPTYNCDKANIWFNDIKKLYDKDYVKVLYLKRSNGSIFLPYEDNNDPYGSVENQKLLESISLFNIKKYVKNYEIKEYDYYSIGDVIYEIVN